MGNLTSARRGLRAIALTLLGLLGAGCSVEPHEGDEEKLDTTTEPIEGGTILSATTVGKLGFAKVFTSVGSCSGSVVASSSFWQRTFVLTASHCMQVNVPEPATVQVNGKDYFGTTHPHPLWQEGQAAYDIALVEIPAAVEVLDPSGAILSEYRRPFYLGDVSAVINKAGVIVGAGRQDGFPDESCDPVGTGANDGLVRWVEHPSLSNGFDDILAVPMSQLIPTGSRMHKGDSGSPWLFADGAVLPAATRDAAAVTKYWENGVVVGVAARLFCGPIDRYEAQGNRAGATNTSAYIQAKMGNLLWSVGAGDLPWSRNGCWNAWDCVYGQIEKATLLVPALNFL